MKPSKNAICHCGFDLQSPENKEILKQAQYDEMGFRSHFLKIRNAIFFLLMVNFVWGQVICNKGDVTYGVYDKVHIRAPINDGDKNDNIDWSREDFIKNGISIISVYSYCFDINLNNIEDSFLLHREQFDIRENKIWKVIYGRSGSENITERYYNAIGQIIKERKIYNNGRYYYYDSNIEETDYEYDSLHREIKKMEKEITLHYSERDTTEVVNAKIDEYVYNSNNQKIERYHVEKKETTKYFITKRKPKTNCEYLSCFYIKWEYDALSNLTEEIFSKKNEIYLKHNYFYDTLNRVIKQIDSSNLYSTFHCELTITYEYTDTSKIVTEMYNEYKDTIHYYHYYNDNNDNKIVKRCYSNPTGETCAEYFYFYENDKLIKKIEKNSSENVFVTTYSYNEKRLLEEEQNLRNDKITRLIRYYYE